MEKQTLRPQALKLYPIIPATQAWVFNWLPHTKESLMSIFKKILVPIDGSETSKKAIAMALQMAVEQKAEVRLIHSIDELSYVGPYEYSGELVKYARDYGHKVLEDGLSAIHAIGVKGDIKLIDFAGQRLGDTIADEARLWGADLIVLGTHGRRGVGRLLLGSGAEQVIRLAPVPVLIIRST
jgi:nucleotide-binding universal stress UspA family protein